MLVLLLIHHQVWEGKYLLHLLSQDLREEEALPDLGPQVLLPMMVDQDEMEEEMVDEEGLD